MFSSCKRKAVAGNDYFHLSAHVKMGKEKNREGGAGYAAVDLMVGLAWLCSAINCQLIARRGGGGGFHLHFVASIYICIHMYKCI